MRYIEAKIPLFSRAGVIGLLSAEIDQRWVGMSMINVAVTQAAQGIARADVRLAGALTTYSSVDIIIDDNDGVPFPYLQIVFGIEEDPGYPTLAQAEEMIDAEVKRRSGKSQK